MGKFLSRFGNPLSWNLVDRSLLVIALTLPFNLGFYLRIIHLTNHPELEPYYDRPALRQLGNWMTGFGLFWLLLLVLGAFLRKKSPENEPFAHLTVGSWWVLAVIATYFLGALTTPAWLLVVCGGFIAIMLFPRSVAAPSLVLALLLFLVLSGLEITSRLPYGPAFSDPPWMEGRVAQPYLVGSTLAALLPTVFFFVLFFFLVEAARRREALLSRAEEEMRTARDLLGKRVTERTRELQATNERLESEMQKREDLQEQLVQSQKLEAVGRLTSGIAHEFNNLLAVILGRSTLAVQKLREKKDATSDLFAIAKASERATELVGKLLTFGRRQAIRREVLGLNAVVRETADLLRSVLREHIHLSIDLREGLPPVRVDRGQMTQVILNLAMNAQDAMEDGGRLFLETDLAHFAATTQDGDDDIPAGDYAVLRVRDTGVGMEESILGHIFEPFFTTKEVGAGTGLGLSMVYGAVKQHEGVVRVRSKPGRGATFEIFLPTAKAEMESAVESTGGPLPRARTPLRVLVVEDDPELRFLLQEILASAGHSVCEAPNGVEALRLFEEATEPIHLVISDLVMPQMGGLELAARLHQQDGNVKILLVSGYSEAYARRTGEIPEGCFYLPKPFAPDQLLVRIDEIVVEEA